MEKAINQAANTSFFYLEYFDKGRNNTEVNCSFFPSTKNFIVTSQNYKII